jgi:hypothetical protein
MHFWILTTIALGQQPLTLVCPQACQILSQNETTQFLLTYNNQKSLVAPFPYISSVEVISFDYRNSTRRASKSFDWPRQNTQLTVPFRPVEYIDNADIIGIQLRWTEKFHDQSMAGVGSGIMLYIDIRDPTQVPTTPTTSQPTTLVIGGTSSASSLFTHLSYLGLVFLL